MIKDKLTAPTLADVLSDVSSYVNYTTSALVQNVEPLVAQIFNDPDTLYGLIQNGSFFTSTSSLTASSGWPSSFDTASAAIQRAIFANALPLTWSTGLDAATTFIA